MAKLVAALYERRTDVIIGAGAPRAVFRRSQTAAAVKPNREAFYGASAFPQQQLYPLCSFAPAC